MNKVTPKTKEQLVYFLLSNISLGTYDSKFLNNIQSNNLMIKKPLTTNQAILLDKIVTRYRKQLAKLEFHVEELITLPWALAPVQSSPEYTESYLILQDDLLILRSPYKKEFIQEFASAETDGKWCKDKKQWEIPFGIYTLKKCKTILETHYKAVNYCSKITKLFNDLNQYEQNSIWSPTLVYSNNRFLIAAINEPLSEAIKDLDFTTDLKFLAQITRYGIKIDDAALQLFHEKYSLEEIDFAINHKSSVEFDDLTLLDKIEKTGVDLILISQSSNGAKVVDYLNTIRDSFRKTIPVIDVLGEEVDWISNFNQYKFPMIISSGLYILGFSSSKLLAKVVHLVNSKPIIIK